MDRQLLRPCTWIYALLLVLTGVTWGIGRAGLEGLVPALLVLGFALLKAQLIGDHFMGLRRVRGIWRWVIVIWLVLLGGLLSTAFILTP